MVVWVFPRTLAGRIISQNDNNNNNDNDDNNYTT